MQNKTTSNQIVQHALSLFNTVLSRAEKTDIRYTPYMRKIIGKYTKEDPIYKIGKVDSQVVNQIIINDLKQNIPVLNTTKSPKALVKELKELIKRYPKNKPNYVFSNDASYKKNNIFGFSWQFKYRYHYYDKEVSAWSPISDIEAAHNLNLNTYVEGYNLQNTQNKIDFHTKNSLNYFNILSNTISF